MRAYTAGPMDWWAVYLAIGVVVGFFGGMLGIGGGAIMVPMLVMAFDAQGFAREHWLHLAVGTGMSTILFTSLSSVRAHAKRGTVRWDIARAVTPGILAGGLAGVALAGTFSTFALAASFTVIVYIAGVNILVDRAPPASRTLPGAAGLFTAGFVISGLSALVAIGGAFMTVPFLVWCNVKIREAIGTASFAGFPIAVVGTAGYVFIGRDVAGLPDWTVGYVYLPALLGISVSSVLMAPVGAWASHHLPTRVLRRIFGLLLIGFATKMFAGFW
jgi:uncharacterized membrane protein YfcA